jgi:SAM-dependent methyltransferase
MIELRRSDAAAAREVYDALHAGGQLAQLESFYRWVLGLLRPRPGARLLDVSCGSGQLVALARRRGLRAAGVDFALAAVAAAWQRGGPAVVGDGERLPFADGSFDYVTHLGSLEHYEQPARGAAEVRRVLRPGGTALVLVPNAFGLLWNVYWVWRTGAVHDDGQPIQRYADRRTWERTLGAAGLAIERVCKYERPLPRTRQDLVWYARRPRRLAAALLAQLVPTNLASCLVFVCRRADG